jgi:hypothetical protein
MLVLGIHRSMNEVAAIMIGEGEGGTFASLGVYRGGPSLKQMKETISDWRSPSGPMYQLMGDKCKSADGWQNKFELAIAEDISLDVPKFQHINIPHRDGLGTDNDWDGLSSTEAMEDGFTIARKELPVALMRLNQLLADGELQGKGIDTISREIQAIDWATTEKVGAGDNLVLAAAIAIHATMQYRHENSRGDDGIDW